MDDINSVNECHTVTVPNQPKTPMHGFRIPASLYKAALTKAQSEGRTLSDVVRTALVHYLDLPGPSADRSN